MKRTNRISLTINPTKILGVRSIPTGRVDLDLTQFNDNPEQLKDLSIRAWVEYCVGKAIIEAKLRDAWEDEIEEVCKEVSRKISAEFGWYI
jgi:hypothetical protein